MYVVGADENGLGPQLGPMVATAVTLEVESYAAGRLRRRGEALGIADSKRTSAFGRMAVAEGLALALAEREIGRVPEDLDDFLSALGLDGPLSLRAPCPDAANARQCHSEPMPIPAYGGDVADGRDRLRRLEGRSVLRVRRVRSALACVGVINDSIARGRSKWVLDLALFERLLLDAAAATGGRVEAHCGMVGGIRSYPDYSTAFSPEDWSPIEGAEGGRAYELARIGAVRFELSADANHLAVAIASMVGKYVRELTMERIVRFYRAVDPALPEASGYHDPVTRKFVTGASKQLAVLGVRDA
ncbi:MAG: hypothetical protein H5U40_13200, partial [Polyangiaceae bacterium]|nr:hypothetical protein [Polyangiaceae bacterium]